MISRAGAWVRAFGKRGACMGKIKTYKALRNILYGLAFIMLALIMLQAGSWEVGLISFTELGKIAAVYLAMSLLFAGCAYLCDNCYRVEMERQRKACKLKQKREMTANITANRRKIMKQVKNPTFDNEKDENTA